jgi:protein ImuB
MLWAALLPQNESSNSSQSTSEALHGAATWALQFTPRVAIVEDAAVVLEVSASARLFGGRRRLIQRLADEAPDLGMRAPSWAPTSLAALGLARTGAVNGLKRPLVSVVDALPLTALAGTAAHEGMLSRLGCRTLAEVRNLPRGGLARRFGAGMLAALDQAYGLRPDEHPWVELPEDFHARLELMSRVDVAAALLFGARRLLLQLSGWLAARRSGVRAYTLAWCHDAMRSKTAGDGGSLTIRTAETTRDIEHLSRLLAEHLAHVTLLAPVGELQLSVDEVLPMEEKSAALIPDPGQDSESLNLVLERIAARLGPDNVLRPKLTQDHRMEWMVSWQPADARPARRPAVPPAIPQPTFALPAPLRLAAKGTRPMYEGPLTLLSGPHRVEGGWWHRVANAAGQAEEQTAVRDYYVALSEHAGVLWIYQTRLNGEQSAWFLQGIFA